MTLAAQQVVDALRARIGANAYTDHPHAFDETELPAWRLEFADDEQPATLDGSIVEHKLSIKLRGHVRATDALDEELSALSAAVLPLVFAAPLPYAFEPAGDVLRDAATEGEAAIGVIEIPLRAHFFTSLTAPETIL